MTINGISVGSGTVPTGGTDIGTTAVSNAVNNQTGTITVVISFSGASGTGTVRLDDFTLNGTVVPAPTLSVPVSGAGSLAGFPNTCIGNLSGANTFTITGTVLTAANVTVGPLTGYTFSPDNIIPYTASLSLAQPGGSYSKQVYVKFAPVLVQSYNGNIPVGGGGAPAITVAATGSGVNTAPSINDGTVSNITTNSADVAATISVTGCTGISAYGVEYSTTPGFANGAGTPVAGGVLAGGNFTSNLVGLAPPGQPFYFHTYATNGGGTTYGNEGSFTLLNTVPTLSVPVAGAGSLDPFGNVCINTSSTNSFNLSGSVLNGSNITVGPLANYTFSTAAGGPFTNSLTLINGGAGYSYSGGVLSATIYVRLIPLVVGAYNGNIPVSGGGAAAISVAAAGDGVNTATSVSDGLALFVTTSSATLPGTIIDPGCGATIDYGFEYFTAPFTPGMGTGIVVSSSNLASGNFSVDLSLLTPNTTYYYYAYAENAAGTTYSVGNNFTTFTVPTQLVIIGISPASPIALTPFDVTLQAQDAFGNPADVTSDTDIQLAQVGGTGVFTFPNSNAPAATIPNGGNTITINDLIYDIVENVGLTATASAGMVSLGTSAPVMFNVIAYTGSTNFIWNNNVSNAWLNGANWTTNPTPPGAGGVFNQNIATFSSNAGAPGGTVGINMNSVSGDYNLGTIYFNQNYTSAGIVGIGNSSSAVPGTLTLHGAPLNTVGGIAGNNFARLFIANYMNNGSPTLEIRNGVASSQNMTLHLGFAGSMAAGIGKTININTLLTGTQTLTFTGGGNLSLFPSGAATTNTFSGAIVVANGMLIAGSSGAFSAVAPNAITLGNAGNAGKLRLNGNSVTIGGLNTAGVAGNSNIVDNNGSSAATLTINNSAVNVFAGSLQNGSTGALNIIKTGTGNLSFTGLSTFTGLTTVNGGTLILARAGGGTYQSLNSFSVNGAGSMLRISSDQVIKDLTLTTNGILRVDAGVTLTITGTYNPATCFIQNFGTIILQGSAPMSFPGVSATVSNMNNLSINDPFGVSLNNSLNILGTLNLAALGTFTVGANTLTINNPVTGTVTNFAANNTSSIVIAGAAASVNIPSVVTQLKNLTVQNTTGTTLQGNLNISTAFVVSAAAGTIDAGTNTFNGNANVTMAGGNLLLSKNTVVVPEFAGVYSLTGGTVTFNGVGIASDAQTIRPVNYFNLTSSSNGDRILSPSGITGVGNIFTPFTNSYTVINSTVNFYKTNVQNIPAFTFYNLTLSGGAFTKTMIGNIDIQGTLSLATNTKLNLNSLKATLKSTATKTANVDKVNTANSFIYGTTGAFVVERYLAIGPSAPNHGKSWQLLSTPAFGQSLNATWQEGHAPLGTSLATDGFGTTITSEKMNAVARGYDFYTPAGGPSIKTYDYLTNTWKGIDDGSTATTALPLANKKGYMIFVRGDRNVQSSATTANPTTFRTSGKIYSPGTDVPPTSTVVAGKLESVGNPYASEIDFLSLLSTSTGLNTGYYTWDPLVPSFNGYGAYQTISSTNGYIPMPGSANYPASAYTKIQSGQAFFVASTSGGTVTFSENNKTAGSMQVYRPADLSNRRFFRTYLHADDGGLVDGNAVAFDPAFENSLGSDDAVKLENFGENFGINSNNRILSVEARSPVLDSDTIFYTFSKLRQQPYQLRFAPANMSTSGLTAYFIDQLTHSSRALSLSDTTVVDFSITADPASMEPGRFYVVFKQAGPVPVSAIDISGIRNSSGYHTITWKVLNENDIARYELERGTDGNNFGRIKTSNPTNNNSGNPVYHYIDEQPLNGDNFYRVRAVSFGGQVQYSTIIKITSLKAAPSISIFPNPAVDRILQVKFINQPAGNYQVKLINKLGQVVYSNFVRVSSNIDLKFFDLGSKMTPGTYQLVMSMQGVRLVAQVHIQ